MALRYASATLAYYTSGSLRAAITVPAVSGYEFIGIASPAPSWSGVAAKVVGYAYVWATGDVVAYGDGFASGDTITVAVPLMYRRSA